MYHKKYTFTVEMHELYSPETGYGFVTEKNYREQQLLQIPELNSAFIPVPWYQENNSSSIREDLR